MKPVELEDLQVIAVADEGGEGSVEWHAAQVVFSRKDDPESLLLVDYYLSTERSEGAVGEAYTSSELDRDVAEGLFRRIDPIEVPSFHRVVCRRGGHCEVVRRDELIHRRNQALLRRLREALRLVATCADRDATTEAFEAAHDVDPWNLASNLLRCGWRVEHEEHKEDAIDDLLEVEPDPANFRRVSNHWLWRELARDPFTVESTVRGRLARSAREAAERHVMPEFVLAAPVSETIQLKATLLAVLRRRWGFAQPAELAHDDLASALRGEPEALARVDGQLRVSREWRLWTELIDRSPPRALDEMRRSFGPSNLTLGRARCEDLLRVARTWHTLESNAEEHEDRQRAWRSTLARFGAWTVRDGAPWRQGMQLADAVRSRCGIGDRELSSVFELMKEDFGVRVDGARLGGDEAHVVGTMPRRAPPCVFLHANAPRDPLAPRFAAAHELAHLLLTGRTARRDEAWYCVTGAEHGASDDHEQRANAFAAYFIAPREAVRAEVSELPEVGSASFIDAAMRVRKRFGLTAVTAGEHVLNCVSREGTHEKLPADVRRRLRDAASSQQTEFGSRDPVPAVDATTGRSRAFAEILGRCVEIGAVEADKMREVLPRAVA